MPDDFREMLAHVTGGRRYCFVIMTWHAKFAFFQELRRIVAEETGWECIRADNIPQTGDLRGKIHAAIDNASLVLADIADPSLNIYYEVGYAAARNKPLLLLASEDTHIPTNLQGAELIRYNADTVDTRQGFADLERQLRQQLAPHKETHVSLLRAMIIPPKPQPSYILVNPKQQFIPSPQRPHPDEIRTYGDHLGVVGILRAFGSVYGEHVVPELITASQAATDLLARDASFYAIGSNKVNPFTAEVMSLLQEGRPPNWRFGVRPDDAAGPDPEWPLWGDGPEGEFVLPAEKQSPQPGDVYEDYGLILRGPYRQYPDRMLTVLAGPHSLGTGAACLAATTSDLVKEISNRLEAMCDLRACDRAVWVLVRAQASHDRHVDPENVHIERVGVYE